MRISARVKGGISVPINPLTGREFNNAFSHSQQCDAYFSKSIDLPGHKFCQCWCHSDVYESIAPFPTLYEDPEPEDLEVIAQEMRLIDTQVNPEPFDPFQDEDPETVRLNELLNAPEPVSKPVDPICDTCGDPESICECVE